MDGTTKLHQKDSVEYFLRSMLAGGTSGCVAKTIVAPLDRVKILFQGNSPQYTRHAGKLSPFQGRGVPHNSRAAGCHLISACMRARRPLCQALSSAVSGLLERYGKPLASEGYFKATQPCCSGSFRRPRCAS